MEEKELDIILNNLIHRKGGTRDQYRNVMDQIAWHETGGTMNLEQEQLSGGPGRGKYQFESCEGCGGKIAANRAINFYKEQGIPVPQWLADTKKSKMVDASKLDADQQDILFLTNMAMHPKANFSNLWEGKQELKDFWADYHWAGKDEDRSDRIASFQRSEKKSGIPGIYGGNKEGYTSMTSNIPNFQYNDSTEPEVIDERQYAEQPVDATYVEEPTYVPDVKPKQYTFEPQQTAVEFDQTEETSKSPVKLVDSQASFIDDYIKTNKLAMGGMLPFDPTQVDLNQFNEGGTHEQNPYGGVPQGIGRNGRMNTVEEGETSYNFEDGKYIFSNRTMIT